VTGFCAQGESFAVLSYPLVEVTREKRLTQVEREVAELVLAGYSSATIAGQRGVSVRTIANQVASIYRKLAVRSRSELSRYMADRRATEEP
jgi:DNA-binding CsgD family transcriptional regulator